jgi:hypothetical protein
VPKLLTSAALLILMLAPGPLACYLAAGRRRLTLLLRPNLFFIALLLSLIATSFFSILLLAAGRFGVKPLLVLQAGLSGGLLIALLLVRFAGGRRCQLAFVPFAPSKKIGLLLMGGLLLGGLALRLPPSLYVDGGQDQGVYVNLAFYYLRHGGAFVEDPWLARAWSGSLEEQRLLQPFFKGFFAVPQDPVPHRYEDGNRLTGFYIADPAAGQIVPQFYPLHPLWMAIFLALFGPQGSVYSLTFFALLALLAVYYCGRELFANPWAGLIALGILAVNVLQVWVNRYPVSETLAQFWLFSGLYLFLRGRRTGRRGTLSIAAACFGLYAFTRFPALAFLPVYVLAFWLDKAEKKNYLFYNLLLVFNLAALVYGTAFSFPYVNELIGVHLHMNYRWFWWQALLYGGSAILIVNVIKLVGQAWWEKQWSMVRRNRKEILWITAIFSLLALVVRAILSIQPNTGGWTEASFRQLRFLQFPWYLTWPGVIIAFAGLIIWWRQNGEERKLLLPGGLFGFSLFFTFVVELRNPYQFYYGRYFVSEVLPICALAMGYLLAELGRRGKSGRLSAGLVLVGLGVTYLLPYALYPAARVQELAGAYPAMKKIIGELPPDSVTFIGGEAFGPMASLQFHVLGTTLMFLGDRYVLPELEEDRTRQAMRYFLQRGKPVYLLHISELPFRFSSGASLKPELVAKGYHPLVASEKVMQFPRQVVREEIPWWLYKIQSLKPITIKTAAEDLSATPVHWLFEAEAATLRASGGEVVNDAAASEGKAVKASASARAFISGPPHQTFPPGDYKAYFVLKIADSDNRKAVALSVTARSAQGITELANSERRGNVLDQYRTIPLDFKVTQDLSNRPIFFKVTRLDPKVEITVDQVEVRRH